MNTEITNGKIPSGIRSVEFVSFRIAYTWVHEDKFMIKEDGSLWTLRGSTYGWSQGGYFRIKIPTADFWMRETNAENKKEFTPKTAFVSSDCYGSYTNLSVHVPGLRFCPFTGIFWTRQNWDEEYRPEADKWDGWFFEGVKKSERFALALKLAETLIDEPNFKIRHHPSGIADLKKRMECVFKPESLHNGRYYQSRDADAEAELRAFLKIERPRPEKPQILKSITRHIRANKRFLTRSTINFFRMFAGAAVINKALNNKTNEQTNNTKRKNPAILGTHSSRN
jgi:hypothetical protein